MTDKNQPRMRRASRYQKVQNRRAQQNSSDAKFYAGMFTVVGVLALLAILMGAIMINGAPGDFSAMRSWTEPWIFGVTKLEAAGVGFVAFIALAVFLRMRTRKPR